MNVGYVGCELEAVYVPPSIGDRWTSIEKLEVGAQDLHLDARITNGPAA